MDTKEKLRLCPYCEGSISIDAKICRFCGSTLKVNQEKSSSPYETEDNLASLYSPPYAPKKESARQSFYQEEERHYQEAPRTNYKEAVAAKKELEEEKEQEEREKSHIGALLLLSIGAQLFTLAWLVFFFSDHGRLTLEWKSRYWPIYLILSLPLLYQGWKRIKEK